MLRERINLAGSGPASRCTTRTAYVDTDVVLAPDVTLEPNVILRGRPGWRRGA